MSAAMYRFFDLLSRLFANLGGIVLSLLIALTCLSIVGRSINGMLHSDWMQAAAPGLANSLLALGIGPINGDFELVEAGMAFAIFAFLPHCQLRGAHASVDIFTMKLSVRIKQVLRTMIEILFAAALVLIGWQLFEGMMSKRQSGQTTFLLEFPVWLSYAASLVPAVVAALVSVFVASMRIIETVSGHRLLPLEGYDH